MRRLRKPAAPATAQVVHMPAPVGGLNTVSPASAMPVSDSMQSYNLVAAEYGLRTRYGWREWCTNVYGEVNFEVRSILPFAGSAVTGSFDKLFAATSIGIFDVTTSSSSPIIVASFGITVGDAGRGNCHVMVTSAGHFLFYADEENGLFRYEEASDTWAPVSSGVGPGEISGINPASVCFVTVWKNRVWLVEKNSTRAWYLPAGAIAGVAQPFNFAQKFKAGGSLVGLWSWTYDGGAGIDDALVGLSSAGDVVVYQGTDPADDATFSLKGVWQVGGLPQGRNVATDYGGDLLLLTRLGVVSLSRLVSGGGDDRTQYATAKVANIFAAAMAARHFLRGWRILLHPEDNTLLITVPETDTTATTQLAMALGARSWTRYRGLPIFSCAAWGGKLYFGTHNGRVCVNDGPVDGVELENPNAFTNIEFSLLTSFQALGTRKRKRVRLIRPVLLSESTNQVFSVAARYDFNLFDAVFLPTPSLATIPGSSSWDTGLWDSALWAGEYIPSKDVRGTTGIGTDVAVALRGSADSRTVLVGFDVVFDVGGIL